MNSVKTAATKEEKDIAVIVNSYQRPGAQCSKAARMASAVLGQVARAFL
jgi:hypothetical protein